MFSHPRLIGCLDSPTGEITAPSETTIRGWVLPRAAAETAEVLEIRAWIGRQEFRGPCGIWRADVAAGHPERANAGACGFLIPAQWSAGVNSLRIEVRVGGVAWETLLERSVSVVPAAAEAVPGAVAPRVVAAVQRSAAEIIRLQASLESRARSAAADRLVATILAEHTDWSADTECCGHLDTPAEFGASLHGKVAISGWLFARTRRVVRVVARLGANAENSVIHGGARADVAALFAAEFPAAAHAQFHGLVDALGEATGRAEIELLPLAVWAELDDGTRRLALQRHVLVAPPGYEALPRWGLGTMHSAALGLSFASRRAGVVGAESYRVYREAAAAIAATRALFPAAGRAFRERPLETATFRAGARVAVVTHNLNREGAPLIALELAKHLQVAARCEVTVVSGEDGPLRRVAESGGLTVQLVPGSAVLRATDESGLAASQRAVAEGFAWASVDLVVANSLPAFWAVFAARTAGRPAAFYLHERGPAARFFAQLPQPPAEAVVRAAERALGEADRVVFAARATRESYAAFDRRGNQRICPSWIDATAVRGAAAEHDRATVRQALNLPVEATVVLTAGTVGARKGLHVLLAAARRLRVDFTARAPVVFLCVGARPGLFTEVLERDAAAAFPDGSFRVIAETSDLAPYLAAADVVCSASYEESFPRVLLEGAAAGRPIVATRIDGVPEMLRERQEAVLVPAGDPAALATGLARVLALSAAERSELGRRAQARVQAEFATEVALPRHAGLLAALAGPGGSPG